MDRFTEKVLGIVPQLTFPKKRGSGTNSAKHPEGRSGLLVPDPFSSTGDLKDSA